MTLCSVFNYFLFCVTGNQMTLGGATLAVTTSEQTNLLTDSLPNTNESVPANNYIAFILPKCFFYGKKLKVATLNAHKFWCQYECSCQKRKHRNISCNL